MAEALLTKEAVLGAKDIEIKIADVPEWGGKVKLVGLTAAARDAFTVAISEGKGRDKDFSMVNVRAKFVSLHMVEPKMTPKELGLKSSSVLERLYDTCAKLSGMSEEHKKELEKNLSGALTDDSPSGSPDG